MGSLKNKRILITRPHHQADALCRSVSDNGGTPLRFPTIEIQSVLNDDGLKNCFANIEHYDVVIFVSRNAVATVFEHYLDKEVLLSLSSSTQPRLLAIGAGTASALISLNLLHVLHAGVQADSEALLRSTVLNEKYIANKRVLIIRGVGGRELLASTLKTRGAVVDYAEVYRRSLPEANVHQYQQIWQNDKPDALIISSNEGLENLLKLTVQRDNKKLLNTPMVVMSDRNAELARQKGFVSEIILAKEKSDSGLLSALLELVGEIEK